MAKLKLKEEDKELDKETVDDSSEDVVQTTIDKLKEEKRKKLKEEEEDNENIDLKDEDEDKLEEDTSDDEEDDKNDEDEDKLEEDTSDDEEDEDYKEDDEEKLEEDEDNAAIEDIASRIKSSVKLPDTDEPKDDELKEEEEDEVEDDSDVEDEEKLDENDNVDELNAKIISKDDVDVKDDVDALVKDKNLSEDFKKMAKTIIESAIVSKSNEVINEALKIVKEDIRNYKKSLNESYLNKINDYTSLVVENWTKDNAKLLIEQAQHQTSTSLIKGIKTLFESHNFEVPNQKVDMFDKLLEENIKLEDQINSILVENININKKYKELYKNQVINEESSDLSLNQKEKLKLLSESINFSNEKEFRKQLLNVKKSYFNNKKYDNKIENNNTPVQLNEQHIVDDEIKAIVETMHKYSRK